MKRRYLSIPSILLILISPLSLMGETGALDYGFGDNGILKSTHQGTWSRIALLPDDRIVVSGVLHSGEALTNSLIGVYTPDGRPDPTFGKDGVVVFPDVTYATQPLPIAVQNGVTAPKIVMVILGVDTKGTVSTSDDKRDPFLTRLTLDGTVDATFGKEGKFALKSDEVVKDLTLQSDGKILYISSSNLKRLDSQGQGFDPSFGNGGCGLGCTFFGSFAGANMKKLLLQADGKIVVVGNDASASYSSKLALHRYSPQGVLDSSFANGAKIVCPSDDCTVDSVALQSVGGEEKILIAGQYNCPASSGACDAFLARFNSNGTPDTTFASKGFLGLTEFPDPTNTPYEGYAAVYGEVFGAKGVAVKKDGKIVLNTSPKLLFQFDPNGAPDLSFGYKGRIAMDAKISYEAIHLDGAGRLLLAGAVGNALLARVDLEGIQPVCGNGRVEGGEGCDDGNMDSFDSCSSLCQIEEAAASSKPSSKVPSLSEPSGGCSLL